MTKTLTHNEVHEEQHREVQRDMDLQSISQDLDNLFTQKCKYNVFENLQLFEQLKITSSQEEKYFCD